MYKNPFHLQRCAVKCLIKDCFSKLYFFREIILRLLVSFDEAQLTKELEFRTIITPDVEMREKIRFYDQIYILMYHQKQNNWYPQWFLL